MFTVSPKPGLKRPPILGHGELNGLYYREKKRRVSKEVQTNRSIPFRDTKSPDLKSHIHQIVFSISIKHTIRQCLNRRRTQLRRRSSVRSTCFPPPSSESPREIKSSILILTHLRVAGRFIRCGWSPRCPNHRSPNMRVVEGNKDTVARETGAVVTWKSFTTFHLSPSAFEAAVDDSLSAAVPWWLRVHGRRLTDSMRCCHLCCQCLCNIERQARTRCSDGWRNDGNKSKGYMQRFIESSAV